MIYIISIGSSVPETIITNKELERWGSKLTASELDEVSGIKERRTILPLEYLNTTHNTDVRVAPMQWNKSPTELGVEAVLQAVERAGIQLEEIGLVIGDSSTPIETTPSEGQRIAGKLGLKVPSYDITTPGVAFSGHLKILNSWKPERLPKYTLCVTSNTPTMSINYADSPAMVYFGDGAAAMIVSSQVKTGLLVKDVEVTYSPKSGSDIVVHSLSHIELHLEEAIKNASSALKNMVKKAINNNKIPHESLRIVTGNFDIWSPHSLSRELELSSDKFWSVTSKYGDSFSSSPMIALAEHWNDIGEKDTIVVATVGSGIAQGYVVLNKV